jgi:hypothetical protein
MGIKDSQYVSININITFKTKTLHRTGKRLYVAESHHPLKNTYLGT